MADPRSRPWLVLGLDPSWAAPGDSADAATRLALVRRAYRRALLQHHPDKRAGAGTALTPAAAFTVDEIKAAYAVLTGGQQQQQQQHVLGSADSAMTDADAAPMATGLEVVDLDELPYDAATATWYRACRCGNPRGYAFGERDLEEELDAEALEVLVGEEEEHNKPARPKPAPAGELLVGCQDCSLWLCVHFAVAPDGEGEGEDDSEDDGPE